MIGIFFNVFCFFVVTTLNVTFYIPMARRYRETGKLAQYSLTVAWVVLSWITVAGCIAIKVIGIMSPSAAQTAWLLRSGSKDSIFLSACPLMQMNLDLQKEIGTPEPSHVREMTKEDMIRYLRPELWRAERNLLQENHIPKPMLPPDGRREKILERNYDVAIVKMIYELFPDEPRKLTRGDLMAEFFDDPTPDEAPAEPDPGVSP